MNIDLAQSFNFESCARSGRTVCGSSDFVDNPNGNTCSSVCVFFFNLKYYSSC